MPDKTFGDEVVINIIVGIIVFLVVISLMVFLILFYQKKRFLHQQQLAEKNKEYMQLLLQSQIEIQEQTFNSISSEIHDNVGQVLSLAKVQLNIIGQHETLNRTMLTEAKESVSKALTDLRDIARSLNSDRVRKANLYEITMDELDRINRSGIMTTAAACKGDVVNIREQKKLIIFRMIQESLQNIIKHSSATHIDVLFNYEADHVNISISDNGVGIDKSLPVPNSGMGLQNIFNRAELIGAIAVIDSAPGAGTTIHIKSTYE